MTIWNGTRKCNLVIHGISEWRDKDNVENVIELGKLLNVNLAHGDIDIVHAVEWTQNPRSILDPQRVSYTKPDGILEMFSHKI